jgi:hypothetical protein
MEHKEINYATDHLVVNDGPVMHGVPKAEEHCIRVSHKDTDEVFLISETV